MAGVDETDLRIAEDALAEGELRLPVFASVCCRYHTLGPGRPRLRVGNPLDPGDRQQPHRIGREGSATVVRTKEMPIAALGIGPGDDVALAAADKVEPPEVRPGIDETPALAPIVGAQQPVVAGRKGDVAGHPLQVAHVAGVVVPPRVNRPPGPAAV